MSDLGPEFKRVVIDVRPPILPDLMATLGDFAIQHDISVDIGNSPDEVYQPKISLDEDPQYNPDLVTWLLDAESGSKIAVVTQNNMEASVIAHKYKPGFSTRTYMALTRSYYPTGWAGGGSTEGYVYVGQTRIEGLLASRLPELVDNLSSGVLKVNNIGARSIQFLDEYAQALRPKQPLPLISPR